MAADAAAQAWEYADEVPTCREGRLYDLRRARDLVRRQHEAHPRDDPGREGKAHWSYGKNHARYPIYKGIREEVGRWPSDAD